MKRLFIGVIVGFLAACTAAAADGEPRWFPESYSGTGIIEGPDWEFHAVETPKGTVECIYGGGYRSGGPSCNWEKYNQENDEAISSR